MRVCDFFSAVFATAILFGGLAPARAEEAPDPAKLRPRIAKSLLPSIRGELEITDLNASYLNEGRLKVVPLGRGFAWFDTGIPESLLDASSYVATLEKRQGLKISCPEEISFRQGYISLEDLNTLIESKYSKSEYGNYLRRVLAEQRQAIVAASNSNSGMVS